MQSLLFPLYICNTQYPVGQGGLHLGEIFVDNKSLYSYVYDCGTINKFEILKKQIDKLIEDLNSNKHNIFNSKVQLTDLYIFISHLHQDHVNGLTYLKDKLIENNVKFLKKDSKIKLVLPYTEDIEKTIILLSYEDKDNMSFDNYKNFLANPKTFFIDYFKIIYINNKMGDREVPSYLRQMQDGTFMTNHNNEDIKNLPLGEWCLKLFYKEIDKEKMLKIKELKTLKFEDITENKIKEVKQKYKKMLSNINLSSLCLYSGQKSGISDNNYFHTGDIDLKDTKIQNELRKHYKNELGKMKTIQVPHHGSKQNSNLKIMYDLFPNNKQLFVTKQENPNPKNNKEPKYFSEYANLNKKINQVTENGDSLFINSSNILCKKKELL